MFLKSFQNAAVDLCPITKITTYLQCLRPIL